MTSSFPTAPGPRIDPEELPGIPGALLRYRIMAWIVGVLLVLLVLVAMPLKYFAGQPDWVTWIGMPHGWLYAILLVMAYDLGRRVKWSWPRLLAIALCGTIPFLTFVAERQATKDVKSRLARAVADEKPAVSSL